MKLALKVNYISLEISAQTGCCNVLIYCHFILAMAYVLPTKRRKAAIQWHCATFEQSFPFSIPHHQFFHLLLNYLIAVIQTAEGTGLKYLYDRFSLLPLL